MDERILVIDQGTTSTRATLFDRSGRPLREARRPLRQIYPAPGRVEQDPAEIWSDALAVISEVIADERVAAVGIANQRETTVIWDRRTGDPIHHAIVWQDRRTADRCREVVERGLDQVIAERSGLVVDPYFSASKIAWLLEHVDGARSLAERGEILFGTVDTFLLWRLTGGSVHATDATNASRTMLFNIRRGEWDDELLAIWDVPRAMLPEVRDSAGTHGTVDAGLPGAGTPITGIAGDQQAATVGQACFTPGMMKSTYGTGAFLVLNTGDTPVRSRRRLLTTIAYQLDGTSTYALEGSIFNAGTTVEWLRDGLGIIAHAGEVEALAARAPEDGEVVIVPAFTGLGAPHWRADAFGAVFGLTRDSGREHLARAALEAVAFQTRDLLEAMFSDGAPEATELRVDGGLVANDLVTQWIADICATPVVRPENIETTALGAAFLAGVGGGLYGSLDEVASHWRAERRFEPRPTDDLRERKVARWREAVARLLS